MERGEIAVRLVIVAAAYFIGTEVLSMPYFGLAIFGVTALAGGLIMGALTARFLRRLEGESELKSAKGGREKE